MNRKLLPLAITLALFLVLAVTGYARPADTTTVSGAITHQGQPVAGVEVHLNWITDDVFTREPFGGSRLTLFPDGGEVRPELMQRLANEMGCGETAFVLPDRQSRSHRAGLRVFTPLVELPFAGHSVLGATFALDHLGIPGSPAQNLGGEEPVEEDHLGLLDQPFGFKRHQIRVAGTRPHKIDLAPLRPFQLPSPPLLLDPVLPYQRDHGSALLPP